MARRPRLEFAGAICHVISRGNYRKELFEDGSARDFEKTLFEACAKCGWLLLAKRYCADWAVASEEYRENLKNLYAELEEPAVWGGSRSG